MNSLDKLIEISKDFNRELEETARDQRIKITNHTKDNEDVVRYVANNGKYQINMETLGENKMSEEQFKELATFHFNTKEDV